MIIKRLKTTGVYGYLGIDITFNEDLTFLTGLNGSGKTTALRLLIGLLAPSLDDLLAISFESAKATVSTEGKEIEIEAVRSSKGLSISISSHEASVKLSPTEIQALSESPSRDEHQSPLYLKTFAHPVFKAIKALSTPMFLGLDRRLHFEERDFESGARLRRRELEMQRRYLEFGDLPSRRITDAVLADVNDLVVTTWSEIRAAQERLDEELRNQILLDSFRYEATASTSLTWPTRTALNSFRERQAAIEKAAAGLRLPVGELQSSLSQFFERITKIVDAIEAESPTQPTNKRRSKGKELQPEAPAYFIEWMMNSRQADRIFKQIQLLDEYVTKRATLHQPIDRFLALANGFLNQSGKTLMGSERGNLRVSLNNGEVQRGLFALSSGERQLVVMLAHLSLNRKLSESGVFIVDEPELSLHLSWQEQFVEAIQKANPNVQLIMATHSPAIILDRVDKCLSLDQV